MRRLAALLAAATAGCAEIAAPSTPEATYREEVACYGFFYYAGFADGMAARDAFRARAIASGRRAGYGPDKVAADAEAASTGLIRELQGASDETIQARQAEIETACRQRLGR